MERKQTVLKRIILLILGCAAVIVLCGSQLLPHISKNKASAPTPPTAAPPASTDTLTVTPLPNPLPGELTHLYFSETHSYFERVQHYEFFAENGIYTVHFWLTNEDEPYPVTVDQAWVDTLTDIVYRNNMVLWNGFDKSSSVLLDGTSFIVTLKFSDDTSVNARGYGKFPDSYGEASEAIDAHFMQLLPEEMRTW